jgi:hypothetical protein
MSFFGIQIGLLQVELQTRFTTATLQLPEWKTWKMWNL